MLKVFVINLYFKYV